jgi:hypothetical protein
MGLTNNLGKLSNMITSTGSAVGIGTNSPANLLDIVKAGTNSIRVQNTANTSDAYYIAQNTGGSAFFGINSTGPYIYTLEALSFQVITNNSERLRITSTGNVGIGTTSPTFKLHVLASDGLMGMFGTSSTSGGYVGFRHSTSTIYGYLGTGNFLLTGAAVSDFAMTTGGSGNLVFGTGAGNERMRITSGGNVTISRPSSGATLLQLQGTDAYGDTSTLQLCSGRAYIRSTILVSANGDTDITFGTQNGGSVAERVKITSAGQLQITQSGNGYPDGLRLTNTNAAYWILVAGGDNNLYLGYNASDRGQFNNSTGAYTALSDINKKKDFEESTTGLDAILGLKPTLYRMKDDEEAIEKHLGFIAQEVREFIPQAYTESLNGDNTFIGLDYQAITATLVKAIQEQQQQIQELKSLINK